MPYFFTQIGTFSSMNCWAPTTPTSLVGSGAVSKTNLRPRSLQASSMIILRRVVVSLLMWRGNEIWTKVLAPSCLAFQGMR